MRLSWEAEHWNSPSTPAPAAVRGNGQIRSGPTMPPDRAAVNGKLGRWGGPDFYSREGYSEVITVDNRRFHSLRIPIKGSMIFLAVVAVLVLGIR